MDKDFKTEIENVEEQLRQAMLASDVKALDEMLSPDLAFTNHLGQCLGKEADLSVHESGVLTISQLETSEQQVNLVGSNVAVVSVCVQVAGNYAGQPAGGDFRFTRVWTQSSSGQWQVAAAHSGIVA